MMKSWVRKSLKVGILSAGFLLAGGGAAQADVATDWISAFNIGAVNGNHIAIPVQIPVDVCGNAIAIGGDAQAGCRGGSWADLESGRTESIASDWLSAFNIGIANGNQIAVPISVPVDVSGNAIAIGGDAQAGSMGGAWSTLGADTESGRTESGRTESGNDWLTAGNIGILNGNQVYVPIQIPINICGNAIGVLGDAAAGCRGGSWATLESGRTEQGFANDWVSALNIGIANGNQIAALVQVPINICGNAIGLLGDAQAACVGGSWATQGGGEDDDWDGDNGDYGYHGKQAPAPAKKADTKVAKTEALPVVGGLLPTDTLLGGSDRKADTKGGWQGHEDDGGCANDWLSALNIGVLNGNQIAVPVQVPINLSGNAIAVGGDAQAFSVGGAWATAC